MGSQAPVSGPNEGQHKAAFHLVGNAEGLEPFELTPEQERQVKGGATEVEPRRKLIRWYFAEKHEVFPEAFDRLWMGATEAYWHFLLLNQRHTRISRDAMLMSIDAKVWDVLARAFVHKSPFYPEYPFDQNAARHDESAPMSQEFDKMRERLKIPLVPDGSRTHPASDAPENIAPAQLSPEAFKAFIEENGLWGIASPDAVNRYSTPLPPPQPPKSFAPATAGGMLEGLRIGPTLKKTNGVLSQWQCVLLLTKHIMLVRAHQVGPTHLEFQAFKERSRDRHSLLSLVNFDQEGTEGFDSVSDHEIKQRLGLESGTLIDLLEGPAMSEIFWSRPEFRLCCTILRAHKTAGEESNDERNERAEILKRVNNHIILRWSPQRDGSLPAHVLQELRNRCGAADGPFQPVFNFPCIIFIHVESEMDLLVLREINIVDGAISMYESVYIENFNTKPYQLVCKVDMLTDNTYNMSSYEPGGLWTASEGKQMQKMGNFIKKGKALLVYSVFDPALEEQYRDHNRILRTGEKKIESRLSRRYGGMLEAMKSHPKDWLENMEPQLGKRPAQHHPPGQPSNKKLLN